MKYYPGKKITIIKSIKNGVVPCGIPYTFGTLNRVEDNIKGIGPAKKMGIDFLIDEVTAIDSDKKYLVLKKSIILKKK